MNTLIRLDVHADLLGVNATLLVLSCRGSHLYMYLQFFSFIKSIIDMIGFFYMCISQSIFFKLHGPSMFAVKAKIFGVLYKQSSSIAFDETSSYWSALKRF